MYIISICFLPICVWTCVGLCVSCLEQRFTSINYIVNPRLSWSAKASPGRSSSLSRVELNLRSLQGSRRDLLRSFLSCKTLLPSLFLFSLSLCPYLCFPIFLLPPRPPGCSLSKPIVSMHFTNKLCSSKGYEAHFCSATHCCSIISCYHDIAPLKPSILGGKKSGHSKGTSCIEFNHTSLIFYFFSFYHIFLL